MSSVPPLGAAIREKAVADESPKREIARKQSPTQNPCRQRNAGQGSSEQPLFQSDCRTENRRCVE